jgi:hypothetical protein
MGPISNLAIPFFFSRFRSPGAARECLVPNVPVMSWQIQYGVRNMQITVSSRIQKYSIRYYLQYISGNLGNKSQNAHFSRDESTKRKILYVGTNTKDGFLLTTTYY